MLIVCYDFANDKTRTQFSKFLEQYGYRLQYSVFSVKNSNRVLNNIKTEVETKYNKKIKDTDHVLIFSVCKGCEDKILRYGSAKHELESVINL